MSTELAWAAGFFDGEGTIGAFQDNKSGRRISIQMSVGQAGTETSPPKSLTEFHRIIGVGTIYARKKGRSHMGKKPMWYWRASNVDNTKAAINKLLPYVIEKRDQIAEAVALRSEWEGTYADRQRFCKRGHEFTPENTYTYKNRPTPARLCRACNRENTRSSRVRRKALNLASATERVG